MLLSTAERKFHDEGFTRELIFSGGIIFVSPDKKFQVNLYTRLDKNEAEKISKIIVRSTEDIKGEHIDFRSVKSAIRFCFKGFIQLSV